jgi:Fe-S oxidoreductase
VLDALDLCLSCKGCTNECPVGVDMPTLKSEFLAHHYAHRLRPRQAYAFGLIDLWARLASHAPGLANAVTHAPVLSRLAKSAAGVSPERRIPSFAPAGFRERFAHETLPANGSRRVLLWVDTFTEHFEPYAGLAAARLLGDAGFRVSLPPAGLCCGRPLYDYGFLSRARRYLERILEALRDEIRDGTPVVGIEPSCVAVLRDELVKLLPGDEDARRLSRQTFHLAEFLRSEAIGWTPPAIDGRVLLHGHCHARATGGFEPEQQLLEAAGAEVETPDSGCCGMAGGWGYESAHYGVSKACAERALLPAIRSAEPGTALVASGFSCRSQIAQLGGGHAVHVAELLSQAAARSPAPLRPASSQPPPPE